MDNEEVVIIEDDEIHVQEVWDTFPGELPRDYLSRISKHIIRKLIDEALDKDKVPAKVRADIWERLLVRSVPQKQAIDVSPGVTDFDKLTDEEVKQWLLDKMRALPEPEE
jgi:hypothetical protein